MMLRFCVVVTVACTSTAVPSTSWAQPSEVVTDQPDPEPVASGAVGAGVVDARGAAIVDVGLDVAGPEYAMGLGARLRWLWDGSFRREEWDERSEWATVLRYLTYRYQSDATRASLALGQLGDARLGHGSVLGGYTTGLHLDHRRLGAEWRIEGRQIGAEAVIDDLVAPRIAGARAYYHHSLASAPSIRIDFGGGAITDGAAPVAMPGADPSEMVIIGQLDGQIAIRGDRLSGTLYGDLVAIGRAAAGVHIGTLATATIENTTLTMRGELQLGTDHYIATWMGPLYDLRRQDSMITQLDRSRAGDLGGLGHSLEVRASHPAAGELVMSYRHRPGLGKVLWGRLSAPHFRAVQVAAVAAVELDQPNQGPSENIWVVAGELRAHLPKHVFIAAEFARLYQEDGRSASPAWLATIAVGAAITPSGL